MSACGKDALFSSLDLRIMCMLLSKYMVNLVISGALGGLIRGIVGFIKYQFAYKNTRFEPKYFALIVFLSSFIGASVSWAVANSGIKLTFVDEINPAISFFIGYAGGDFIENVYKIILGKDSLYLTPSTKKK